MYAFLRVSSGLHDRGAASRIHASYSCVARTMSIVLDFNGQPTFKFQQISPENRAQMTTYIRFDNGTIGIESSRYPA